MNYTLYVQKLSKTRSPINTAIIENMNIYQTLKHSQTTGQPYKLVRRVRRQALFFPTHTNKTPTPKCQNSSTISIETAVVEIASKNRCIVLFQICNVECSFVDITNDTKYRTFCFFPQVDRTENFASKMASLFRPVGRKKKPIQLRFTNSSSKIHKFLCTSLYLSRRSILKKTCQASEKSAPKPRFSGPFYTFPILFQTHSISSGNENKNIWCRDFHEIRASYSNSTYLNPVRVWVGPKTKYMVSWLLGKFVPESKPFLFFLHGMHTCMFALKKSSFIFYDSWNAT